MRVRQMFGRKPSHLVLYGYDPDRGSFFAEVSTFRLHGRGDFVAAVGFEGRVERAASIAKFLAPWADLEPVQIRELERDRVLARRSTPFTR